MITQLEKYGPVNTIVLSRAGADNIYYPATLPSNPKEIKITDNQIMNGNNRDTYMPDIYNKLNGLEYYINDFSSTGITYYNLCDRYNVKIGDNTYSCVMFNDEINVTQGLEENVYTEMPEDAETDYKKSDTTDRRINQTTLIVDKQQQEITALVDTTQDIQKEINPTQDASGSSIYLEDSTDAELVNFEMEGKTTQENEPTPDYPSELVSVGYKNYFEAEYLQTTANTNINANLYKNTYTLSLETKQNFGGVIYIQLYKNNTLITTNGHLLNTSSAVSFSSSSYWYYFSNIPNGNKLTFTLDDDYSLKIALSNATGSQKAFLVKGSQEHSYIPYGKYGIEVTARDNENNSKTYLYTLNQPLRSIGDTKDLLYIKNGILYVERKIGSVDLSTITWSTYGHNIENYHRYSATTIPNIKYVSKNTQLGNGMAEKYVLDVGRGITSKTNKIAIDVSQVSVVAVDSPTGEFIYELAEPYTEELGKVDIPNTYKTITHINTTDDNEPNMNITYVRDTQLTNYVEEHISQIIVNEEEITQRVQTIEESDYDSRLNAVEQKQTDTDLTIDIISTNIDKTNGNIREVTTTTGFTFNAEGMTIEDTSSQFKAQHRIDGTYYKDGDTTVGQYTKDGSKQKDLALFGVYYYGMNDIDDTPMFVAQLYTDNNGEEGFGHFPNRSD